MKTGPGHLLAELRSQTIAHHADLLLHDMGAGLADGYVEGKATGSLWRTVPLWSIGDTDRAMGTARRSGYLHEGEQSGQRFMGLSVADREALLAFLRSL